MLGSDSAQSFPCTIARGRLARFLIGFTAGKDAAVGGEELT